MRSPYIRKIYLIWRQERHQRRIVVGEICFDRKIGGYSFKYDPDGVIEASKFGFINYPDFPDTNTTYTKDVLEIFSQRLNVLSRTDTKKYFDFWEIDKRFENDKYYLLAQTQGLLSTDNFEFLSSYYLKKNLAFISEIAGISYKKIKPGLLTIGDGLTWEREPNNTYDRNAVLVKKGNIKLGFVKQIHNQVFKDKRANTLKISVKDIENNGHVSRVFISIRNV